eukprot:380636-Pelagomonas_calceolata.AAC.10
MTVQEAGRGNIHVRGNGRAKGDDRAEGCGRRWQLGQTSSWLPGLMQPSLPQGSANPVRGCRILLPAASDSFQAKCTLNYVLLIVSSRQHAP